MPFEPGKSGNPNGRPKTVLADGRSLSELAREHTEDAVDMLVAAMNDGAASVQARVAAACALLDRGWGRPKQEMVGSMDSKVITIVTGVPRGGEDR
jgi:hypothetical protein